MLGGLDEASGTGRRSLPRPPGCRGSLHATPSDRNQKGVTIEALAVIARLKPGAQPEAARLLENGPPFDVEGAGLQRHRAFLSADEVVFVFEGHQVEWIVDELVSDPYASAIGEALEAWRPLVDEPPRIARPMYAWERE